MRQFESKGHTVNFERIDIYRLLHELVVDYLGDRDYQGRDRHDGLTQEYQEFKKHLAELLRYTYLVGFNLGKQEVFRLLEQERSQLLKEYKYNSDFTESEQRTQLDLVTKNWKEIKED